MANRHFGELVRAQWDKGHFLCVGLDPELSKIAESVRMENVGDTIIAFNRAIVDATKDIVVAYKPNAAFYESEGVEGWRALKETVAYIHAVAPQVPVILDAKRGDIGNTNKGYARMAFDLVGADAVTVQPYVGGESLEPFLGRSDKGVFVVVKTSNEGSGEFQNLECNGESLYKTVARHVAEKWNKNGNCGVVVGTTYPEEMRDVRAIVGTIPILMPGTGAQGGDLEASVQAGKNKNGSGMIINVSRAVLYASDQSDFASAARTRAQEFAGVISKALV